MKGLFTRSLAETWRATNPAPTPAVRQLTRSQRVLVALLWVLLIPFLLLGFLVLGERPHLKA
jgi:hypothetical protein